MLDKKTVEHIANLAKLELSEGELQSYTQQLSSVFGHFEQLSQIDTHGVEAMTTASPIVHEVREDQITNSSGSESSLKNSEYRSGNLFSVPPVV